MRGEPSLVKMLPEGAHRGLVRAAAHIVAHRVIRAGHDEQLAGGAAQASRFSNAILSGTKWSSSPWISKIGTSVFLSASTVE